MSLRQRSGTLLLGTEIAFGAFWGGVSVCLPAIAQDAHLDNRELGADLLLQGVGAILLVRRGGRIVDHYGDGKVTGASLIVVALALAFLGAATNRYEVGTAMVVLGGASGVLDVAVISSITRRSICTIARAHGCFSIGVVVSSITVGLVREVVGGAFPILASLAGVFVLTGTAVMLWLPDEARVLDRTPQFSEISQTTPASETRAPLSMLLVGVLCALAYLVESSWQTWSPTWMERGLRSSPAIAGLAPALFDGAAAIIRVSLAGVAFRAGPSRVLRRAGGASVVAIVVATTTFSPLVSLIGIAAVGASISLCAPTLLEHLLRAPLSGSRADVLAHVSRTAYVGMLIGPSVVGGLASLFGLHVALATLGVVSVVIATFGAGFASRLTLVANDTPKVAEPAVWHRKVVLKLHLSRSIASETQRSSAG